MIVKKEKSSNNNNHVTKHFKNLLRYAAGKKTTLIILWEIAVFLFTDLNSFISSEGGKDDASAACSLGSDELIWS